MKTVYAILLTALTSFALAAADAPDRPTQPENVQGKHEDLTYRQRMVTGKVMDVKDADVTAEGKAENHVLLKVNTYSNHTVCVDVGPRSGLHGDIKTGDEIAAFGIAGRLNQRPLIVASKIATIVPINGREEIFESIPVSFDRTQSQGNAAMNPDSNGRFSQEALRRSNENTFDNQRAIDTRARNVYSNDGFRTPCEDR